MKNTIVAVVVLIIAGVGLYFLLQRPVPVAVVPTDTTQNNGQATTTASAPVVEGASVVIGKSVEGRDITAYNFGQGTTQLLFIGGIHGGYSWNTSLLAYQLMDYLTKNPNTIPTNIKVTVIPVLNPDGLNKVVNATGVFTASQVTASQSVQISGRYNANKVDLSRNFDCDWKSVGTWQTTAVSGGSAAFSEPESLALKNYVTSHNPSAVVVWYSAAGGVYSSSCDGAVSPQTTTLTNTYAQASGYPAFDSFDFYETSGDLPNWLAKINIPAISVLLTNHTDTEWNKNLQGVLSVLNQYSK
jgi:hypothetical protein